MFPKRRLFLLNLLWRSFSVTLLLTLTYLHHSQWVGCHPHIRLESDCVPTDHFVHIRFVFVLNEVIRCDHLIKSHVLTPRYLLQSINGPLKLSHFLWKLIGCISLRLYHIHLFLKVSIEKCSFYIHLPDVVIVLCSYGKKNFDLLNHRNYWKGLAIVNF